MKKRKIYLAFILSAFCAFTMFSQTGPGSIQFVMVTNFGSATIETDSTWSIECTHPASQLGQGYNPTQIDSLFLIFDGVGRRYEVLENVTSDFGSSTLRVKELQDQNIAPLGVGVVYQRPDEGDQILADVEGNSGLSPVTIAKIKIHNALNSGSGGSTGDDITLDPSSTIFSSTTLQDWMEELSPLFEAETNPNVWYVSKSGNAGTAVKGDVTKPFPFSSFPALKDSVSANDVIFIQPGIYTTGLVSSGADIEDDGTDLEKTSICVDSALIVLSAGAIIKNTANAFQPLFYDTLGLFTRVVGLGEIQNPDGTANLGHLNHVNSRLYIDVSRVTNNTDNAGWLFGFRVYQARKVFINTKELVPENTRFLHLENTTIDSIDVNIRTNSTYIPSWSDQTFKMNRGKIINSSITLDLGTITGNLKYDIFFFGAGMDSSTINLKIDNATLKGEQNQYSFLAIHPNNAAAVTNSTTVIECGNCQADKPVMSIGRMNGANSNSKIIIKGNYRTLTSYPVFQTSAQVEGVQVFMDGTFTSNGGPVIRKTNTIDLTLSGIFETYGDTCAIQNTTTNGEITFLGARLLTGNSHPAIESTVEETMFAAGGFAEDNSFTNVTFERLPEFGAVESSSIYTGSDSLTQENTIVDLDKETQSLALGDFEDFVNYGGPYGDNDIGLYVDYKGDGSVGMANNKDGQLNYSFVYDNSYGSYSSKNGLTSSIDGAANITNKYARTGETTSSNGTGGGIRRGYKYTAIDSSGQQYFNGDFNLYDHLNLRFFEGTIWADASVPSTSYSSYVMPYTGTGFTAPSDPSWRVSTRTFYELSIAMDSDTTNNSISLYNGKYKLPNATPSTTNSEKSIMTWTGTGSSNDSDIETVGDLFPRFLLYNTGGGATDVANGAPEKINGDTGGTDTQITEMGGWDITTTIGRAEWTGTETVYVHITACVSSALSSVGDMYYYLAKNGTVIAHSRNRRNHGNTDYGSMTFSADIELSTDDYIEVYCEPVTGTETVTISDMRIMGEIIEYR